MFSGVNREAFVAVKGTLSVRARIKDVRDASDPKKAISRFQSRLGKK